MTSQRSSSNRRMFTDGYQAPIGPPRQSQSSRAVLPIIGLIELGLRLWASYNAAVFDHHCPAAPDMRGRDDVVARRSTKTHRSSASDSSTNLTFGESALHSSLTGRVPVAVSPPLSQLQGRDSLRLAPGVCPACRCHRSSGNLLR